MTYIRVKRFKTNFNFFSGFARRMWCILTRQQWAAATVSEHPDLDLIKGKRVLMVDDCAMTGGTLRAAAEYCMNAGATNVQGIVLSTDMLWTPRKTTTRKPKRSSSAFTPWGTY